MVASVDWSKLQKSKLATVQGLLKVEEPFGIDTTKRREIRAFVRAIHALVDLSVQHGHNNLYVYKRPDAVIKLLIKLGYLPSDALVGREGFFELTHLVRVSLNVSLYYLMTYEAEIKAAIEDHTDKDADEVFNVLLFSSVIHSTNGGQPFRANVLNHTVSRVNALPRSCRHTVLTGDHLLQLASA
jgi:hypothetical protein